MITKTTFRLLIIILVMGGINSCDTKKKKEEPVKKSFSAPTPLMDTDFETINNENFEYSKYMQDDKKTYYLEYTKLPIDNDMIALMGGTDYGGLTLVKGIYNDNTGLVQNLIVKAADSNGRTQDRDRYLVNENGNICPNICDLPLKEDAAMPAQDALRYTGKDSCDDYVKKYMKSANEIDPVRMMFIPKSVTEVWKKNKVSFVQIANAFKDGKRVLYLLSFGAPTGGGARASYLPEFSFMLDADHLCEGNCW